MCCAPLRAGSPIDSPVRRRSLSPRSRSRTPPRGGSAQQMHWKKKLDALFDRGVVRSSELDDRTLDALDGAVPFRQCVQQGAVPRHSNCLTALLNMPSVCAWQSRTEVSLRFTLSRSCCVERS